MKKNISLLVLIIATMLFISCDDSLPKVTDEQAIESVAAYGASIHGFATESMGAADQVGIEISTSGTVTTATFNSYDLSDMLAGITETSSYTSASGTLTVDTSENGLIVADLTFTGGPVVSFYVEAIFDNGVTLVLINGHDMTDLLSNYVEQY